MDVVSFNYLYFLILTLSVKFTRTVGGCIAGSKVTHRPFSDTIVNHTLVGPVMSSITAMNERECEMECHLAVPDLCYMFNYYPSSKVCELLYKDRPAEYKVEKKKGSTFKTRKCESSPCSIPQQCVAIGAQNNTLCLDFTDPHAKRNYYVRIIQPQTYTDWGRWAENVDWCAEGSYAYGFSLKVEAHRGGGDDSALNAIKLFCRGAQNHSITSLTQKWGSWTSPKLCPPGYLLNGAQVRSEPDQGDKDDSAANNYNFLCQDTKNTSSTLLLQGKGMPWGSWTARRDCPTGSYICGIKTKVESNQGSGDDSALNDAIFYCCTAKE